MLHTYYFEKITISEMEHHPKISNHCSIVNFFVEIKSLKWSIILKFLIHAPLYYTNVFFNGASFIDPQSMLHIKKIEFSPNGASIMDLLSMLHTNTLKRNLTFIKWSIKPGCFIDAPNRYFRNVLNFLKMEHRTRKPYSCSRLIFL